MKRLFAIILTFTMILSLSACKDNNGTGTKQPSTGSDFTQAEIDKILEEMENQEKDAE